MENVTIHPSAIVETRRVGPGTRIWAFTHISYGVTIGQDCNIGEHCFVESGVIIGDRVTIKNGNMLWRGVTLEDGVFVGPGVLFTNDRYPRSARYAPARYTNPDWCVPTVICKGASIGAGAVILPGARIHTYAMVGAGAVVTNDVPAYAIVYGNPARLYGWVCQCGHPLQFQNQSATCARCDLHYVEEDGLVKAINWVPRVGTATNKWIK